MNEQLGRRGFLRAIAAAPAAAVAAKASLAEALGKHATGNIVANSGLYAGVNQAPSSNDIEQLKWELGHATSSLSNLYDDPPVVRTPALLRASAYADSLRSVSPSARIIIAEREATRLERHERKSYAEKSIAAIKKKLGILGVFL